MARWAISFTADVDDDEYSAEFEACEAVMNDYVAREYAGHYLHVETAAPVDRICAESLDVSYEVVDA